MRRAVRALGVARVQRDEVARRPAAARQSPLATNARAVELQAVRLAVLHLEAGHVEVLLCAELQAGAQLHRTAHVVEAVLPGPALVWVQEPRLLPLHVVLHAQVELPRPLACPPGARGAVHRRTDVIQHPGGAARAGRQEVGVVAVARVRVHLEDGALVGALLDLRVGDGRVGAVPQYARLDRSHYQYSWLSEKPGNRQALPGPGHGLSLSLTERWWDDQIELGRRKERVNFLRDKTLRGGIDVEELDAVSGQSGTREAGNREGGNCRDHGGKPGLGERARVCEGGTQAVKDFCAKTVRLKLIWIDSNKTEAGYLRQSPGYFVQRRVPQERRVPGVSRASPGYSRQAPGTSGRAATVQS
eukprot:113240-Hanusia_phi.AAC.2